MTVYGTYGSSLQQGDVAPGNCRERGRSAAAVSEHPGGSRIQGGVPRVIFSTAVFRLDRPFATTDTLDNVFTISGDQVNYGLEAMLTGRVADRLVLYGGLTVLNPSSPRPAMRPRTGSSSWAFRP